jgi:hypothetical protein
MDKSTKATLAAGMTAGYVVGRTKKGKLALSLLSIAAGRSLDPAALLGQGMRKLARSPQFTELSEHLRRELLDTGRGAVKSRANGGVEALTEALRRRTETLLKTEDEDAAAADEDEDAAEDEDGDAAADGDETEAGGDDDTEADEGASEDKDKGDGEADEAAAPDKRGRRTRAPGPQGGRAKPSRSRETSAASRSPAASGRGAKAASKGAGARRRTAADKPSAGGSGNRRAGGDHE